jgi:hypothetical protein
VNFIDVAVGGRQHFVQIHAAQNDLPFPRRRTRPHPIVFGPFERRAQGGAQIHVQRVCAGPAGSTRDAGRGVEESLRRPACGADVVEAAGVRAGSENSGDLAGGCPFAASQGRPANLFASWSSQDHGATASTTKAPPTTITLVE